MKSKIRFAKEIITNPVDLDRQGFSMKGLSWFAAGIAVAVLGVFVLPWFIPTPGPVKGDSYSFGFYNKAAVIALCFSFLLVLVGLVHQGKKPVGFTWFVSSPIIFPPFRKALSEYIVLGLATLICIVAVMVWNAYLINPYWSESGYFLGRIDLAILGYKPYTDFQFDYGPALIYAPIWLDWLSGETLGIENAYAWCIALGYAMGFMALFVFQRFLNLPDHDRPWILALSLLIWFLLSMGIQYTPLRYAALPCAITLGNRSLLRLSPGLFPFIQALALITLCGTACYMISPEMGIASTVGFASSTVVYFWGRRTLSAVAGLGGICLSVALISRFSFHYLESISSFASGAYNFPIYPNLVNLMFVAASLYVLPKIACSIWREPVNPVAPLTAGIGAAATTLLPAAFGRCDPGHVLINGLMIFMLLFSAFGQIRRSLLIGWGVLFGISFIALGQVSYWNSYWPQWQAAIQDHNFCHRNPELVRRWSADWDSAGMTSKNYWLFNWHKAIPYPEIGDDITHSQSRITAPLGADVALDRYLKIRNSFVPEYHPAVSSEIYTPKDVARVVNETKTKYDFLLIQQTTLSNIFYMMNHPADEKDTWKFMSVLLLYPVHDAFRNKPYIPEIELAKSLYVNSTIAARKGDYLLLKPPR